MSENVDADEEMDEEGAVDADVSEGAGDGRGDPCDTDAASSDGADLPAEDADAYNYDHFDFGVYGPRVERRVDAGDPAPDGTLYTVDGLDVRLSALWSETPAVIEFGSITCPIFCERVDAMDRLAARYADEVAFRVVYTREAHPGSRYGPHENVVEKGENAVAAMEAEGIQRPVLVDDVDGEVHRAFDGLPNSVYVVGTDGVVAYRADWVDPDDLARHIDILLAAGGRGADVEPASVVENYRQPSPSMLATGLRVFRRAGRGSLRDFIRSLPSMLRHRLSG